MSAQLVAEHGLTINDYECLLYLAHAEEGRMRRVDLAEQLILTASGVTRLLDGLEQAGWVERASCASDRRVTYAVLTASGRAKLQEAADSHIAGVRTFFEERFSAGRDRDPRPAARPAARRRRLSRRSKLFGLAAAAAHSL